MTNDASGLLAAIVLCGGRSVRMGADKANVMLGHETLLQRVCRITSDVASPIVVVAGEGQELPSLARDVIVIRDRYPGEGPLGGLLTGMLHLQDMLGDQWTTASVWATTCDAPFVNSNIIRFLSSRFDGSSNAVAVSHQGHKNPFGAVYRSTAMSGIQNAFAGGERRAAAALESDDVVMLSSEELTAFDPDLLCLKNVNTPQDLEFARNSLLRTSKD